ncbi:MAG: DUF1080 domain-containing protein [Phycisphaerales bacterium]|nr:MAG: DUF1080 domain-containing protein [Phycisphaerales bacterium]
MIGKSVNRDSRYYFFVVARRAIVVLLLLVVCTAISSCARPETEEVTLVEEPRIVVTEPKETADAFMGDWQGSWKLDDGTESGPLAAQVIALGDGKYRAKFIEGFDLTVSPYAVVDGLREGGKVGLIGKGEYEGTDLKVQAMIGEEKLSGNFQWQDWDGQEIAGSFSLSKTVRLSPTLGAKPPAGAIVLFDGTNLDEWEHTQRKQGVSSAQWRLVEGGAMEVKRGTGSIVTKKKFKEFKLHLEFRTPFMPAARGQGRGNSGVYLQGRYEVQVLDSYGLEGKDNECGGIYKVGAPLVNMCAPPMQWQTYDVTFRAPRFDGAGNKISDATATVIHNGVTIHDNIKLPGPTGGSLDSNVAEPGGIYLQDHGNPVQFRNIWIVELE